jgi:hypothetical protein
MTESAMSAPPSLEEAKGWLGHRVDELGGADIGLVQGLFVDAEDGRPSWLIIRQGRFKGTLVAVPIADCAGGAGRIWTPYGRETIRNAPVVDPTRPLLREHELAICAHYGISESLGRASEVVGRPKSAVTSQPV